MSLFLFDDQFRSHFQPLTLTRSISEIRLGIHTLKERWEQVMGQECQIISEDYLRNIPLNFKTTQLYINARALPTDVLVSEINALEEGQGIFKDALLVAFKSETQFTFGKTEPKDLKRINSKCKFSPLTKITDLFSRNEEMINLDFGRLDKVDGVQLPSHCTLIGDPTLIYVHPTAKVFGACFNTNSGPIYLGPNSEVMEGSVVRGPFVLCNSSTLKLGAKVYGATTIGPHSKVGGEVSNSLVLGYSNKGHDGFMGNSIIGEWCNLGADTNTSNLKNNYSNVRVWSYATEQMEDTGLVFCGLIMGDHSKCSINTMFNTGTVVGVNANIFGSGFPPKFVPSFTWGGGESFSTYKFEKAIETAEKVCARRKIELSVSQKNILKKIFDSTSHFRK